MRWQSVVDTSQPTAESEGRRYARGELFLLQGRSLVLLQQRQDSHPHGPIEEALPRDGDDRVA
jgi:hypothetical protein